MRESMEAVAKIARAEPDLAIVLRLLRDEAAYKQMANAVNPYGDGHAAPRAVAAIAQMLGVGERLPDFEPT